MRYPRLPDPTYACQSCGAHFTPPPSRTFASLPPYGRNHCLTRLVILCEACQDAYDQMQQEAV